MGCCSSATAVWRQALRALTGQRVLSFALLTLLCMSASGPKDPFADRRLQGSAVRHDWSYFCRHSWQRLFSSSAAPVCAMQPVPCSAFAGLADSCSFDAVPRLSGTSTSDTKVRQGVAGSFRFSTSWPMPGSVAFPSSAVCCRGCCFHKQIPLGFRVLMNENADVMYCGWMANAKVVDACLPLSPFMWGLEVRTRYFTGLTSATCGLRVKKSIRLLLINTA